MSTIMEETTTDRHVRTGKIIAVAYSPELINNVGKDTHDSAEITRLGIPGDRHYGETRYSKSQRKTLPNDRPITILGVEATRNACEKLGIPPIPPGGLGENLLIDGLGDMSAMGDGDLVQVLDAEGQPKVILRMSKQNDPCSNLRIYHKMMIKELMGKRGVICTVVQEGQVDVGDRVALIKNH